VCVGPGWGRVGGLRPPHAIPLHGRTYHWSITCVPGIEPAALVIPTPQIALAPAPTQAPVQLGLVKEGDDPYRPLGQGVHTPGTGRRRGTG
jgi:hypothetical protein